MNEQTKQAIRLFLEGAGVIGAMYKFWLAHEKEIKEIIHPLMQRCIEIGEGAKAK